MSENSNSDGGSLDLDKPAQASDDVKFPPLPEPDDSDFEDDVGEEEKAYYKSKFPDLNEVVSLKLHCTACDRHLGCSAKNESRMRCHPLLKTLICHACHSFYNSGEFDKGEDGSELYCRWCGQGGQVYCCSACIHVFCAKCIKRNFGLSKIKEIENTDDWKCFKCNPRCLWDMRAICWALLRFCEFRNRIVANTEDPVLKKNYIKIVSLDTTECCRNKSNRREKIDLAKKKEKETVDSVAKKIISKIPPTIQVKKFASINMNESPKIDRKAIKRPASPKNKGQNIFMPSKPLPIAPCGNNVMVAPLLKKIRLPNAPLLTPIRVSTEKKMPNTYGRFASPRPRVPFPIPIMNTQFNGFNNSNQSSLPGDNINLSLETLTQGLDMSAVAAFNNSMSNDHDNDVVCTPDFPMEPLCEVTEDNDDDVECITPAPAVASAAAPARVLPDLSNDNIIQMTENDVSINAVTGGLKFRVDPQTLSSKKMYRLPDGRVFAINPNPSMPGGYSATIVSVAEVGGKPRSHQGTTYAAKVSTVAPAKPAKPKPRTSAARKPPHKPTALRPTASSPTKPKEPEPTERRKSDFKVPVEWYRYNLLDAVDALEYSLAKLNKLKRDAPTATLRTRTVDEMKYLHRSLEQVLTTSSKRFLEIRDSLSRELKLFISRKNGKRGEIASDDDDDDDDVEILGDASEDPIFIDENSVDSVDNAQEVDLTGAASGSDHNTSNDKDDADPLREDRPARAADKSTDSNADDPFKSSDEKPDEESDKRGNREDAASEEDAVEPESAKAEEKSEEEKKSEAGTDGKECDESGRRDGSGKDNDDSLTDAEAELDKDVSANGDDKGDETIPEVKSDLNGDAEKVSDDRKSMEVDSADRLDTQNKADFIEKRGLNVSEDLIDSLLQDDNLDSVDNVFNSSSLDIPDLLDKE